MKIFLTLSIAALLATVAGAQQRDSLGRGSRVFIAPAADDLSEQFAAEIIRQKLPLKLVADQEAADYIIRPGLEQPAVPPEKQGWCGTGSGPKGKAVFIFSTYSEHGPPIWALRWPVEGKTKELTDTREEARQMVERIGAELFNPPLATNR